MANNHNMLQLCRLCLVKDDVNIPIFEEQGDIRQIFLKISSCLPVKVSREDRLPKKICDGCSYKLDMLYEFWNTSANAEKQLLSWLGEAGVSSKLADGAITAISQQMKPAADTFVKEETLENDGHVDDDDKDYLFEQQKVEESASAGPSATVTSNEEEEPPPKRARRTAAVKAAIAMDQDSDDDDDSGEPLTKIEDESEDSDGEDHVPTFVDVPSTSADDQPGPSGVGKDGVEAPCLCDTCRREFSTKRDLKIHSESIRLVYDCSRCDETRKVSEPVCACSCREKTCHYCGKGLPVFSVEDHICFHGVLPDDSKFFGQFTCDLCQTVFPTATESREHSMKLGGFYQCVICSKITADTRCCGKSLTKCAFCKKTVKCSQDHLCFHLRSFQDFTALKEIERCLDCRIILQSNPIATEKIPNHICGATEAELKCTVCFVSYDDVKSLKRHVASIGPFFWCTKCCLLSNDYHHSCDVGFLRCAFCRKSFRALPKDHICFHIKTSKDFASLIKNQKVCCSWCDAIVEVGELMNHRRLRHFEKCKICGGEIKSNLLRHHMRNAHKTWLCSCCDLPFSEPQRSQLEHYRHVKKKKSIEVFICELCGKQIANLFDHMVRMHSEPTHQCHKCKRLFKTTEYLKRHMLVHSDEQHHKCLKCEKKFKNRFNMRVHMRTHDEVKPFSCSICQKGFTTKQWRNNHMLTHKVG